MSVTLKRVIRLVGFGLIILGIVGNLPQGWALASMGAGFAGVIAAGGGG